MMPDPVRLFHITAIDNLKAICEARALVCKNKGAAQGINYQNIAHAGAQGARAARRAPDPPGGTIHDYVPFYFAPRSPMLFAINGGRVAGCPYTQEDIVHLETTVPMVMELGQGIVFYDRNATLSFSIPYTNIELLTSEIDWDIITEAPRLDGFCKYFNDMPTNERYVDRRSKRQAEFLVQNQVPLETITRIGVINEQKAQLVRAICESAGVNLRIEVMTDWYFLGQ